MTSQTCIDRNPARLSGWPPPTLRSGVRAADPSSVTVSQPAADQSRSERLCARLGLVSYAVAAGSALSAAGAVLTGHSIPPLLVTLLVTVLHLVLVLRLAAAMTMERERRGSRAGLLAAVVLFALGSAAMGTMIHGHRYPMSAEVVLLPAYAGLAVFLSLDFERAHRVALGPLLDVLVISNAAGCLAGLVILTPVTNAFPDQDGPGLLLLLAYPLLVAMMGLGVLTNFVVGRRVWSVQGWAELGGLGLIAAADAIVLRSVSVPGVPDPGPWYALCLGCGLTFITASACGSRPRAQPRSLAERNTLAPALAAFVPIFTLAVTHVLYLTLVALLTLASVGVRLALALREARDGATEALRLAKTDPLTGLPNRGVVISRVEDADRSDEPLGLLLLDLDGFKFFNDTLGHPAGDTLLRLLADRLRDDLPDDRLLARLGGDEFAVLTPSTVPAAMLAEATHIREVIARPMNVLGHSIALDASVGIAVRAPHTTDGPELVRQADIAMYQAKAQHAGVLLYHPGQDEFTTERLRLAEELRAGIANNELEVWYQPQVTAADHVAIGLEALIRWNHPELGLLAPVRFLDVARQAGLMPLLTQEVTDTVLADAVRLLSDGITTHLSFNVSPAELLNVALLTRLLAAVDLAELPARTLVLEVTEESLLADPERAQNAIWQVSQHHVDVSIDDYGSGFSCLSYLRDLPVQELKLDRSFVTAVGRDPRSRIIVEATARMAHGLGLRTIAEGVEDAVTAEALHRLGVDILQGYHFAKPMPLPQLRMWLSRHASTSRT